MLFQIGVINGILRHASFEAIGGDSSLWVGSNILEAIKASVIRHKPRVRDLSADAIAG